MRLRRNPRVLLFTGLAGSLIVALCCFTPLLVGLLTVLGLGVLTGYLDIVLLPALAGFLGLFAYGLVMMKRSRTPACCMQSMQPISTDHDWPHHVEREKG